MEKNKFNPGTIVKVIRCRKRQATTLLTDQVHSLLLSVNYSLRNYGAGDKQQHSYLDHQNSTRFGQFNFHLKSEVETRSESESGRDIEL